jgi:hypothetical protein
MTRKQFKPKLFLPTSTKAATLPQNFTEEQEALFETFSTLFNKNPKGKLVINSLAGTGKTSSVLSLAQKNQDKSFLMVCFNAKNAEELNHRALGNGICNLQALTLNKIAYDWLVQNTRTYPKPFIPVDWLQNNVVNSLHLSDKLAENVSWKLSALMKGYFNSSYASCGSFLASLEQSPDFDEEHYQASKALLFYEENFFNLQDIKGTPVSFEASMKLYQIFGGQFPSTDVIIVEEYQDINSVQANIIAQQQAFIVAIGDIYQDIYSWRGSGEFIEIVRKERWPELALTTSFRVNPKDAKLANKLLSSLGCGNTELKGVSKKQEVETTAYLFRTNAAALLTASKLLDEGEEFKLTLDLKAIWDELWYVHFLLQNKVQGKKAPETIGWIKTKEAFLKAIEYSSEIKRYFNLYTLISQKQGGLYGMQQKFNKLAEDSENKVLPITISTCHKAKGLEWDLVILGQDLHEETVNFGNHEGAKSESEPREFLRLLYISVTRAKVRTEMSQELFQYIYYLGEETWSKAS